MSGDWWSPETSGRALGWIDPRIMDEADSESDGAPADFDATEPNVVTSVASRNEAGVPTWHLPVLDIDLEARLVPSSTPGHYHLFIEKLVDTPHYEKLLKVLAECGIIGAGYEHFSMERGYTTARLPHSKKPTTEEPL